MSLGSRRRDMPTTTILGCSFALHPSPRGPVLADSRWQHLPWVINPALAGRNAGLREAVARRELWWAHGGVGVCPVKTPDSSEPFVDVPSDEPWAEVATSFVRAPAELLPFCVLEQLLAILDAGAVEARDGSDG